MSSGILIFVLQFLFQLTRTLGTRYVAKDNIAGSVITSFFIQGLWLTTTFLGVVFMAEMNWIGIAGYMIGGMLGVYASMKMKLKHSYSPKVKFYSPSIFDKIANMDYSKAIEENKDNVTIRKKSHDWLCTCKECTKDSPELF